MEVYILSEWHLGNGKKTLDVYREFADARYAARTLVDEFNATCPGRKADGSRHVAEPVIRDDRANDDKIVAEWQASGLVGWFIEEHEVK